MDIPNFFKHLPGNIPKPSAFLTPKDVEKEARARAAKLFQHRDLLEKIVERHEETIRTRWGKKTRSQKRKVLLEAWPGMSSEHRPDVAAWKKHSTSDTKEAYMWPYINLEDLTKTKTLLIMLHYRGRNQPHEFVRSDLEQAALGEASGATMRGFLDEYTMLFADRKTPKSYVKLISWDDDDDAFESMTNGIGMHPGHGLQALEIQERIWSFLVKCCQILLQDIQSMTKSPVLPNPGPPITQDLDVASLQIKSFEAPYRTPTHLDFARLKTLASEERNWREEHLWSLREDPSYFAEMMHEQAEHRPEMLLDTLRNEHPLLKEPGRPLFWNRVIGNVVIQAYFGFATFDEVLKQINNVANIYEKRKATLKPDEDLPADLLSAFQHLRFLLGAARTDIVNCLKIELFASPPLRPFCRREPHDPKSDVIRSAYCPPLQEHAVHRLMPLFDILFDDQQLFVFGLHTVTDEIERLTAKDPAVAALLTPRIASRLSSLSVVSECLQQIHFFQPWARKIEDGMDSKACELQKQYNRTFKGWLPILNAKFEGSQIYRYADPTDGKFNYPTDRRQNKQNVETMRESEANLDILWRAVDRHYRSRSANSQHDMVAHMLRSNRKIQRTPVWVEPGKKKRRRRKKVTIVEPPMVHLYRPSSSVYQEFSKPITGDFVDVALDEPSVESKTDGDVAPGSKAETPTSAPDEATEHPETFAVGKRSHRVSSNISHSLSDPNQPAEVPWNDFMHAIVNMGFSAEKPHGSTWSFAPRKIGLRAENSIQFREPHVSSDIPFLWAKRIQQRLARAYGWVGGVFKAA
ncbi:hypothetical protein COCSADRAFT_41383 [Bipolaris sorokiniana ND90Pr]|uniref:Clr5 domain-containing protein n=1 Tax=Cochliobolus sativus (strain ND90Pr / ATCC 201652) TaxID=665912 RepID=M2RUJ3_COCSN|nr:uncharacterized protein COCSADRAFT_41383 [Bipolaris sorokiniana ND90Pr]EMD58813.1 hypothetical protein COCSADRAFT_41383 [Bipolaris sorokiniana ND90Pr]